VKYILFDLDGTLLDNDVSIFLPYYFDLLATKFSPFLDKERMVQALLGATKAMIEAWHPEKYNKEFFWEKFEEMTSVPYEKVQQATENFYDVDYPRLSYLTKEIPGARQLLIDLLNNGYELVLATNALFPQKAIYQRMAWAKIEDLPFILVTTYENMHSGKPNLNYYKEILELIKAQPQEALMVGNSLQEDMIAKKLGISTFYLLKDDDAFDPDLVDFSGSLEDLRPILLS